MQANAGLKECENNVQRYIGLFQYLDKRLKDEILREKAAMAVRADAPKEEPKAPKKKASHKETAKKKVAAQK